MGIDRAQPIPLYFQLKTLIREEILSGRYRPGDKLPTEHEFCRRYSVSRTPVTRALSELADEGVVLRRRRHGTVVNPHWLRRSADQPELRVITPAEGPWEHMLRAAARDDVRVSIVTVPRTSLHQALVHAVADGRAPDLAVLDSAWAPEFAAAGFLYALEELDGDWLRTEHEVDFLRAVVAANRYDGATFGVSAFGDVAGLWYRRSALDAVGARPPATWHELRRVAHALAGRRRSAPIAMPGGSKGGETTTYCLLAFLASNGATVLGADGVTLGARAVQALQFLRRLIDEGLMPADVVGYEWNRSLRLLAQGRAAISFGGSYEARPLAEALGVPLPELAEHVGFTAMPGGPRGAPASVAGAMVLGIFRQAAHPHAAMRLLQRAVDPAALVEVARTTGRIPARRSAVALAAPDLPFVSLTADLFDRAVTRPPLPLYSRVSAQLQATLEAVLTRRVGPTAAVRRAADLIAAITGLPVASEDGARASTAG